MDIIYQVVIREATKMIALPFNVGPDGHIEINENGDLVFHDGHQIIKAFSFGNWQEVTRIKSN